MKGLDVPPDTKRRAVLLVISLVRSSRCPFPYVRSAFVLQAASLSPLPLLNYCRPPPPTLQRLASSHGAPSGMPFTRTVNGTRCMLFRSSQVSQSWWARAEREVQPYINMPSYI